MCGMQNASPTLQAGTSIMDVALARRKARIAIRNQMSDLIRVVSFVDAFAAANGVPEDAANALNLCLDEILNNVLSYGFLVPGDHRVTVDLSVAEGRLSAEVVDDGEPFDPTKAPAPDLSSGIRDRPVGGVGLLFVRKLMDEVRYTRRRGRNRLRISKKFMNAVRKESPC